MRCGRTVGAVVKGRIGIEIDGRRAVAVRVVDGAIVDHAVADADDGPTAFAQVIARLRLDAPARIGFVRDDVTVRRLEVRADEIASRAAFAGAVFELLPLDPDDHLVAGLVPDPGDLANDAVATATCAVVPREPVEALYRLAGRRKVEIVPVPFTLVGRDGLYLALRRSSTDLTWLVDGKVRAWRQLAAGGIDTAAAGLGEGGAGRFGAALAGTGDPVANDVLNRWIDAAIGEVRATMAQWRRSGGADVPDDVHLLGPGAASPPVLRALAQAQFALVSDVDVDVALGAVGGAGPERLGLAGAYLAAITHGQGGAAAAWPNPVELARARSTHRRKRNARIAATIAIGATVVSALAIALPVRGQAQLEAAREREAAAAARIRAAGGADEVLRIERLDAQLATLRAGQPAWQEQLGAIRASAPPNTTLHQLSATRHEDGIAVSVQATTVGAPYDSLTEWMRRLGRDLGARDVVTTTFAAVRDDAGTHTLSYGVTFTLPVAGAGARP